jgi:hypothetical protein
MGSYDDIYGVDEERHDAQVKCWDCEGRTYRAGDSVPAIDGHSTYSILLREIGGRTPISDVFGVAPSPRKHPPCYVVIRDGHIVDVLADVPLEGAPVFDKWGSVVS